MAENVKGISTFTGCLIGSKMLVNSGNYQLYLQFYRKPGIFDDVDRDWFDRKRAIELGMIARLADHMCAGGATDKEFYNIIVYAYLLIDAVRYEVDFPKAAKDLNIKEIKEKYEKVQLIKEETK